MAGDGNDRLRGNGGDDDLVGGAGIDAAIYLGAAAGVTVTLGSGAKQNTGGAGYDRLAGIENLSGSNFDDHLVGDDQANVIDGRDGNDVIYDRGGADVMAGRGGNDIFWVNDAADIVIETAGEGIDTVKLSIDGYDGYRLPAHVEWLQLLSGMETGRGNDLDNRIVGNAGINRLNGMGGADRLEGKKGDDRYFVDDSGDAVIEGTGNGIDTVVSSIDHALRANVENLLLTGAAVHGVGNDAVNLVRGNDLANLLDGAYGADWLFGGRGDDTCLVENSGDRVVERGGEGVDTVRSTVSFRLSAHVENLVLTLDGGIDGTGNDLANILTGARGDNRLVARGGNDTLSGLEGDDTLIGGDGADIAFGGVGYDHLVGDAGADILLGGLGFDRLDGGAGNDRIGGGLERDRLTGGAGNDLFYFDTAPHPVQNADVILDFTAADDAIMLSRAVFEAISADGRLAGGAFRIGTRAADADDRILHDQDGGRIFYDADGNGAAFGAILFARVTPGLALTHADFVAYSGGGLPPEPQLG